jgi:membrane-associated phospholipid phosphatase
VSDSDRPTLRDRVMPVVDAWRPLAVVGVAWLVVVTVAGLLLVGPLDDSGIVRTDLAIERWLVEHRTATLDALAEAGTWLAETITVPVVLLVAIAVAWRVSANVAAPAFLAVAVGGEKLMYLISSLIVGRDRPPVPTVGTTYATSSFPSGHVASAITLYGAIALIVTSKRSHAARAVALVVVAAITTTVAVCRMYCGFHYLSDCVAGVLTGAVWLSATYVLIFRPGEIQDHRAEAPPERTMVRATLPSELRVGHTDGSGDRSDAVGQRPER